MDGLSSPPNRVGVADCAISRIGTRRSGRLPVTWILREPAIGAVTDWESSRAARARSEGMAFIGFSFLQGEGRSGRRRHEARRAPYAHVVRGRSFLRRYGPDQVRRDSLSPRIRMGTPASTVIQARSGAGSERQTLTWRGEYARMNISTAASALALTSSAN